MTIQKAESVTIVWSDGGIEQHEDITVQTVTSVNTDTKAENKQKFISFNLIHEKKRVISPSQFTSWGDDPKKKAPTG